MNQPRVLPRKCLPAAKGRGQEKDERIMLDVYEKLLSGEDKLALVGLG